MSHNGSPWIHITNLPLYYDDYGLQDIFSGIGEMVATAVTKNQMLLKSCGFVQFANPKHAKLAASKKDQTVIGNSAVRVYLIWSPKEDLSTIKVGNVPNNCTQLSLEQNFEPYGQIVDITFANTHNTDEQKQAFISYSRVDYALQAVQEMNNTIIGIGHPLTVSLVNPDARNLKWKRNSFEYKRMEIPHMSDTRYVQQSHSRTNNRHTHHNHGHGHSHHSHRNKHRRYDHTNNNNITIATHNSNDDSKNPSYPHTHHKQRHNRRHKYRHNNYDDENDHYRHNKHRHRNNRDHRSRNYHSNRNVLLGPLHNESNGQYMTYSVTPSPTRSMLDSDSNSQSYTPNPAQNNINNTHLRVSQIGLQRMNSADSTSSNNSVQSLPNNYSNNSLSLQPPQPNQSRGTTALENYGFPNKQRRHTPHHSPQPYTHHSPQPYTPHNQSVRTPASPASSAGYSTPGTTHSMPTPPAYQFANTNSNIITRSQTPTPLYGHNTPTKSATTPLSTPPLTGNMNTLFTPQTLVPNMNIINGMNAMTMNIGNINNINGMGLISPTNLMFPNLDTTTQNQQSPIVITPTANILLQQQMTQNNMRQQSSLSPLIFNSSPTLQGPLHTPPQPSKRFVFSNNSQQIKQNKSLSPSVVSKSNTSKDSKKKSGKNSHAWTKKQEDLGNKLYGLLQEAYPERVTKIVGMLLMGNKIEDLEFLINRPQILMSVANDYDQKQQKKEVNKNK